MTGRSARSCSWPRGPGPARLSLSPSVGAPQHPLPDPHGAARPRPARGPGGEPTAPGRRGGPRPRLPAPAGCACGCSPSGGASTAPRRPSSCPTSLPCDGLSSSAACGGPTPPTGPRIDSPGRAASSSWCRSPGTSASATTRCRSSTRSASRRTWPGSSPPGSRRTCPRRARSKTRSPQSGGSGRKAEAGAAVVFHDFVPPFGPTVEPWPGGGRGRRRRPGHGPAARSRVGPMTLTLTPPRALDGLTLISGPGEPRLLRSMDVEVSADGSAFERGGGEAAARRAAGPAVRERPSAVRHRPRSHRRPAGRPHGGGGADHALRVRRRVDARPRCSSIPPKSPPPGGRGTSGSTPTSPGPNAATLSRASRGGIERTGTIAACSPLATCPESACARRGGNATFSLLLVAVRPVLRRKGAARGGRLFYVNARVTSLLSMGQRRPVRS